MLENTIIAFYGPMKFLILTQYFPPEIGGAQTRLQSTAAELCRLGHEVEIVAALPNYPKGRIFPEYARSFYRREIRDGLVVHRLWIYPALGSGLARMLNYGSFTLTSVIGLFLAQKPDYIFVESPPLFLGLPAFVASRVWNVPFIFNVADLWPDVILEAGFLREGFIIDMMRWLEQWSYRKAAFVNAVTEGLRDSLLRDKSVPPSKIRFLPNGVDTKLFRQKAPDASLKARLGLEGKRIVLWAGTLGAAHGLNFVLDAAKLIESREDCHFLFVGDGSAKAQLRAQQLKMNLGNVTFLDPVPLDQLPSYFSIAECGLASLRPVPLFDGARPSKIFPVLASGKPLVFVGKGETAELVRRANAGIVVPPEDPQALAEALLTLFEDPHMAGSLGESGRRYVEENLQWEKLVSNWVASLPTPGAGAKGLRGASPVQAKNNAATERDGVCL